MPSNLSKDPAGPALPPQCFPMRTICYSLLTLGLLYLSPCVTAQTGPDLEDNTVTVLSSFEARLIDAERVLVNPAPPRPDTARRRQQYSLSARPLETDYPAPVIKPRGIRREKTEEANSGYAKVGLGIPSQFYGDLSYDVVGIENVDLGLYANHYSFNNDGTVENQRASDTRLGAEASYLFDQGFAVGVGAAYDTRSRYYYGYNFLDRVSDTLQRSFTQDEVRQRFNIFDLHGEIYNGTRTQADFDYRAGAAIYLMDANPAVRETGIDLTIDATKWIGDDALDFHVETDFTRYKDTATQNLNNIIFGGAYTTTVAERIKLRVGARLTSQDDDFDVFPDLRASAPLVDGVLSAFIGAEGGLQKNTLRSLTDYNPWLGTRLRIRNSEYTNLYGGVEGTIYGIAYRAEIGYKILDNLATYVLDYSREIPQFNVLYDDGNLTTIQGTATLPLVENLDLSANFATRFYNLDNQEKAWHLPQTSFNAAGIYNLPAYNLQLRADVFLENGLPYRTESGEADNLNFLTDISLSGEYLLNDNFSLWARVNNLLNNKRERFVRYPTIGTNFLAGAAVRF